VSASALRPDRDVDWSPSQGASLRHFLDLRDFDTATLRQMLDVAANYK
jgi:ornithine carbamoyltransferase